VTVNIAISQTPNNWEWARLSELASGIFDCPHSTPKFAETGPYLARTQDVGTGIFRPETAAHVSMETYRERIARAVPTSGDLLYSREGTYFGIAAEVPDKTLVCLGQRMVLIRPDARLVNYRYLRYWLNSPRMAEYVEAHKDGSVAQRLNLPIIRDIPVPVPPLGVQQGIADLLGELDEKIESNRRAIDLAEGLADAIFKRSAYCDVELATVSEIIMGSSPPGISYNEEGNGAPFYQGVRDFGRRYPNHRVWTTAPVRLAQVDDTLLSVRAPVGQLNRSWEECCVGRGVAAIRSPTPSSVFYALRAADDIWEPFQQEGTVFGAINKADLAKAKVPWPEAGQIVELESDVAALDEKIRSLSVEIHQLENLRDTLLPGLLSGRIRVPEAA
jgi:type I restriction enzyme S subunit